MIVLRKMLELAKLPWQAAVVWLLFDAVFFAMRLCEYLATNIPEEDRRTKILRLRNISLKKNGVTIPHSSPRLKTADIVMIIFESQKNDKRDIQVHMFKRSDNILSPVVAWFNIVKRVWSYPDTTEDSKVCIFRSKNGCTSNIQSTHVRDWLKTIVNLIGEDVLGFTGDDIRLHSI